MNRKARGFTLIELITAVAIFAVLATMLFQIVRGALDIWSLGEGTRESIEKTSSVLDAIAADLRMTAAEQPPSMGGAAAAPVRFLADWGTYDFDGDGQEESSIQRLRFARACPEERTDERIRAAGDSAGGRAAFNDALVSTRRAAAPGGLAEVAWATVRPSTKGADPALLTVVRAFQTPIGLEDGWLSPPGTAVLDDPQHWLKNGVQVADNVLYLGCEFWWRDTRGWDEPVDSATGPLIAWDSTRALLATGKESHPFLLALGPDSLTLPDDDVFPRRVKVTLTIARDADLQVESRLADELPESAKTLRATSTAIFKASAPHKFVKIEGEWLAWTEVRGGDVVVQRGARGTAPASHAAGARIHVGETVERIVEIPVFREDWNDR